MNLTCTTNTVANNHTDPRPYRVSLRCAWRAGEEAPADTQYVLYYRLVPVVTEAVGAFPPILKTHRCSDSGTALGLKRAASTARTR